MQKEKNREKTISKNIHNNKSKKINIQFNSNKFSLKMFFIALLIIEKVINLDFNNSITIIINETGIQNILSYEYYIYNIRPYKIYINDKYQNHSYYQYNLTNNISKITMIFNQKLTNCYKMFYGLSNIISIDLSNFDSSNVINMGYMFFDLRKIFSLDLSNFDTSNF